MHNVVAVVSWRYKPLLAKEREEREGAASGMDTAWKNGALGCVFHSSRPSCENGGHQAPVLLLQRLAACDSALQGGQGQLDPLGVLGVGLLEVPELGRDDGVILHIDEGAGQVGG